MKKKPPRPKPPPHMILPKGLPEIELQKPAERLYDDARCRTCGVPWEEHTDECERHKYRPDWARREPAK